jgi:SPFH domain / Band 7 family
MITLIIVIAVAGAVVLVGFGRTVRIVPQARAYVIERLGSYNRTLDAGLNTIVPFIDRVRARVDLREQVVSFAPQPVITEDNLVVKIDTVLYFQVTDPKAATYEIADFIQAIEQLTVTTLRNVIGGMDLERTLTSREQINGELRGVLDEATGKWGIRVNRVELKAIDPPGSIIDAMEKQLRADRDKRAAILTAEGSPGRPPSDWFCYGRRGEPGDQRSRAACLCADTQPSRTPPTPNRARRHSRARFPPNSTPVVLARSDDLPASPISPAPHIRAAAGAGPGGPWPA